MEKHEMMSLEAVSYTHLDVYKRQDHTCLTETASADTATLDLQGNTILSSFNKWNYRSFDRAVVFSDIGDQLFTDSVSYTHLDVYKRQLLYRYSRFYLLRLPVVLQQFPDYKLPVLY